MISYLNNKSIMFFVAGAIIGSLIGVFFLSYNAFAEGYAQTGSELSPEIFNSAFSPLGASGGKIIPASCSMGQPCHAGSGDMICPCSLPTVSIYGGAGTTITADPMSGGSYYTYVPHGGYRHWGFTSTNASVCDVSTIMMPNASGPYYYYVQTNPASREYAIVGPFTTTATSQFQNPYLEYTIQCWDANRTVSATAKLKVNINVPPKVNVNFQ